MMNHMHNHMMMHKKHFEEAQQTHMMVKGMCCVMTIGIGIAAACLFKLKCLKMRDQMKNCEMDSAECLKDKIE